MADQFKPVVISPLTGIFDSRSSADQQLPNAFSWKQNFQMSPDGKLQQANGFLRPYAINNIIQPNGVACPYKNWDWHQQAPSIAPSDREPPTLLFYSTANDGSRYLYLGTKTKALLLDEVAGTWSTILTGLGADGSSSKTATRWKAAQLQNNIFFANGVDELQYTAVGSGSAGPVIGLRTAGVGGSAITQPAVVIQYQGVLLIMNVVENGARVASRIWWSDLNDGTNWVTSNGSSIADFQDLAYGERILGAAILQGYLVIFTDKSIWKCTFNVTSSIVNNLTVFSAQLVCVNIYTEPESRDRCLAYPNTLVSDGDALYYASRDAIYKFNFYMAKPERTEWIYRASNIIFDDGIGGLSIDESSCASPIMHYWPARKELHFSWTVPDAKFVGPPSCDIQPPLVSSGLNQHTLVLNTQWETCDYRDYGMSALINFSSNITETAQCDLATLFLGASTADLCLKTLGTGYAREIYNVLSDSYSAIGYYPILRGLWPLGANDSDKEIKWVTADGYMPTKDVGIVLSLRMGCAFTNQPMNSNAGNCGIVWYTTKDINARCLMTGDYVKNNLRPSLEHRWNRLTRARFSLFELTIKKSGGAAPTAGGVTLTKLTASAIES